MCTQWRKASRFWHGSKQRIARRWWDTCTIWLPTRMINKKGFYIWVRPWVFTKLVLPIQAAVQRMWQRNFYRNILRVKKFKVVRKQGNNKIKSGLMKVWPSRLNPVQEKGMVNHTIKIHPHNNLTIIVVKKQGDNQIKSSLMKVWPR